MLSSLIGPLVVSVTYPVLPVMMVPGFLVVSVTAGSLRLRAGLKRPPWSVQVALAVADGAVSCIAVLAPVSAAGGLTSLELLVLVVPTAVVVSVPSLSRQAWPGDSSDWVVPAAMVAVPPAMVTNQGVTLPPLPTAHRAGPLPLMLAARSSATVVPGDCQVDDPGGVSR